MCGVCLVCGVCVCVYVCVYVRVCVSVVCVWCVCVCVWCVWCVSMWECVWVWCVFGCGVCVCVCVCGVWYVLVLCCGVYVRVVWVWCVGCVFGVFVFVCGVCVVCVCSVVCVCVCGLWCVSVVCECGVCECGVCGVRMWCVFGACVYVVCECGVCVVRVCMCLVRGVCLCESVCECSVWVCVWCVWCVSMWECVWVWCVVCVCVCVCVCVVWVCRVWCVCVCVCVCVCECGVCVGVSCLTFKPRAWSLAKYRTQTGLLFDSLPLTQLNRTTETWTWQRQALDLLSPLLCVPDGMLGRNSVSFITHSPEKLTPLYERLDRVMTAHLSRPTLNSASLQVIFISPRRIHWYDWSSEIPQHYQRWRTRERVVSSGNKYLEKCSTASVSQQWMLCSEWVPSEWESDKNITIIHSSPSVNIWRRWCTHFNLKLKLSPLSII